MRNYFRPLVLLLLQFIAQAFSPPAGAWLLMEKLMS